MPGNSATLTTCSSARSPAGAGISARVANTTPGTRIRPCPGMTNRYSDSAMIPTGHSLVGRFRGPGGPIPGNNGERDRGRCTVMAHRPAAGRRTTDRSCPERVGLRERVPVVIGRDEPAAGNQDDGPWRHRLLHGKLAAGGCHVLHRSRGCGATAGRTAGAPAGPARGRARPAAGRCPGRAGGGPGAEEPFQLLLRRLALEPACTQRPSQSSVRRGPARTASFRAVLPRIP